MTGVMIGAYIVCAFLVGCRITATFAWRFHERERTTYSYVTRVDSPDGEQWFGACLLGAAAASIWPLALIVFVGRDILLAPPRDVRLKQRDRRIKELERELGL